MLAEFYKYHGAGNDFLVADNRDGRLCLPTETIVRLCNRRTGIGADGLILLEDSVSRDFGMAYYNSDGSGGMMCGNGGRCIVAFAADRGVVSEEGLVEFDAPDGPHEAVLKGHRADKGERTVRLKMKDVIGVEAFPSERAFFLDTGTRHLVKFVEKLGSYPVYDEGKALREDPRFAPLGTNVNFVEPEESLSGTALRIRTFEKGVEDETLACGTGIVASALSAYCLGLPGRAGSGGTVSYLIMAAISDLGVDFVPCENGAVFAAKDIWLTGPAEFVGKVLVQL